ncbi:MAG TPA: hypothetical protein VN764_13990 [Polyangiaceae bacterium]|nr:hypothetical protein [Polyangiaceae bacterium]
MIHLSKTVLILAFTAASLLGCSGLSKDDICEACEGKEEKRCRTSYDVCKLTVFCTVSMMKNRCK